MDSETENITSVQGPEQTGDEVSGHKRTETQRSCTSLPPRPKKKYAKRAEVWQHFLQRDDDSKRCSCRYCGIEISCDMKTVGTSPMRGHISRCKLYKDYKDKDKQKSLGCDDSGNMKVVKYDPSLFRKAVIEMVVINELPLSFVESEGWKRFCSSIIPMYSTFSRKTASKEIVAMYETEKLALKELFERDKQRVSLTTDIWTSPHTSYNYMVITAHWIDLDWQLQKRILSFKIVTDHRGETIKGYLAECLEEWGISKVFTVTVDNATTNDKAIRLLREHLLQLGSEKLVLEGQLIHMRCCEHILNLIVSDGLQRTKLSIVAIRNAIKYVRSSFSRLKSFELRCQSGKISRGSLPLDVKTRWNSTYLILSFAIKLRVAFEKMMLEDKMYCEFFQEADEKTTTKRVGPPTTADWDEVQTLVKFLKIFYKSTLTFSASKTVTSTVCYNEIVNIEKNLITKCRNSDEEIRHQAHAMRDKFEKYWDGLLNMNPLVIVASLFDPRNKMQFASLCFQELYGKDIIECRKLSSSVLSVLHKLYEEYNARLKKLEEEQASAADSELLKPADVMSDDDDDYERVDAIYNKMVSLRGNEDGCSELDIYLTEKTELRVINSLSLPFDVLHWWKCNSSKFPILSQLARDVLAIQVSSVASESTFSTSGRILDPYRSSLTPYMVEVLLCTQQWLRCKFKVEAEIANLNQMLEEIEFFDSLDARNSKE